MPKKLTLEELESKIRKIEYHHFYNKVTICLLTLENGYVLVAHSGTIDSDNFKKDLGEAVAYQNAIDRLWELEGYSSHYHLPSTGDVLDSEQDQSQSFSSIIKAIEDATKTRETIAVQEVSDPNPFKNRLAIQKWIMKVYELNKRGDATKLIPELPNDNFPMLFNKRSEDFTFSFDNELKVQVNRQEIKDFIDYVNLMYKYIHERP